jgi:transcription elongation factor GreA
VAKYLTPEGLRKLKKELDYLKKVKRKEIAKRLKETASFGDLSENAAYQEAKEAQAFLEGKILELEEILQKAKVIKKKKEGNKIQLGSLVSVSLNNQKLKFQIVGPEEANPEKGKISYQSPLGKALLGKAVGAKIEVKTPEGKIHYKILKIE